jgi:nucleotide-binding universal stress UspA family protein
MKMLMCHDGSAQTEKALRFAAVIAKACRADVTLLGVNESAGADAPALLKHLQDVRAQQEREGLSTQILAKSGSPVEQILDHGETRGYDIVVIGAGQPQAEIPAKTYELVRQIKPSVLLVVGERTSLDKMLVCSGGADYTEETVQAAAEIACGTKAQVTLLHVLAEAPLMYSSIIAREQNAEEILASDSTLGRNLLHQKEMLEKLGVPVTVRVRHGDVAQEVLNESEEQRTDLIVVGSTVDRGPLYRYLLGDVTRQIVNHAPCPILVARQKSSVLRLGWWEKLAALFGRGG